MKNLKETNIYTDETIKKTKEEALNNILSQPSIIEALRKLSTE
ncbi:MULTISPECIES: hypothetical protein [Companilactobacillus]|nr:MULTISPECIES: hypothetical protein [Companilactobacillus]